MSDQFDDSEGWEKFEYSAADGLRLAGRKYGWRHNKALPVICLAGLTRNSADFHPLALHLSREAAVPRRVLCLDYRGRGMSDHDKDWEKYNIFTEAADVLAAADALGIGKAITIGTSRGGLVTYVLAATRPGLLAGAVLNDIGPEIDPQGLVRIRNYVGGAESFPNWSEATNAVRSYGKAHFTKWDDDEWRRQARLIYAEKDGRIVKRYDQNLTKTLKSLNLDNPIPPMWPQFAGLKNIPLMAIRGENSDLLSAETLRSMHDAHPGMQSIVVESQGHAPDLATPGIPPAIARFATQVDSGAVH